jgi:hypothetical protein
MSAGNRDTGSAAGQWNPRVEGVDVRQLVEFPLDGGGSIFVEVDDRDGAVGYVRAAWPGDLAARAEETFDAALGVVRSVATGLVGQVQEIGSAFRPRPCSH